MVESRVEAVSVPGCYTVSCDGRQIFSECRYSTGFYFRLRGLMGYRTLPPGNAILLAPCSSIHMCGMRFAIDVIFIDRAATVLKVCSGVRPWIGLAACRGAWGAIECQSGELEGMELKAGDVLRFGRLRVEG